jgi:hypothetical protein
MLLRDNELARRQEGRVELRSRPMRVEWALKELFTADGHELRAGFTCSARALPDATERRMLEEVLMGARYAVSDEDLAKHFEPRLHAAAAKAAQKHSVAEWLGEGASGEMTEALRMAAVAVAFDCGVEVMPPFRLDLASPSFQQQQMRARQHALAEQQTAEQVEHVQRAAGLLKQFAEIRAQTPELSPGRVLEQISAGDRGAVLQTLLLASAREEKAGDLWAVAGPYLVKIDRSGGAAQPRLFPLPPELGPLRSVQRATIEGKRSLLVGARSGFLKVDPENPGEAQLFKDSPPTESALGFNRVVYRGDRLGYAASHGAAGIVCWMGDKPDAPTSRIRPEQLGLRGEVDSSASESSQLVGPRNIEILNDVSMIFSAGGKLFAMEGVNADLLVTPSTAEIIAIVPEERRVIVVHEDGTICAVDRTTRRVTCMVKRSTRLRSAGSLPWLGSVRLLLAEDQGPVECVGLDDPLVTQYQSQHGSLRAVAGSAETVAGISSDRQRLLLWNSWDGTQPVAEIYLTGVTRHRVADVDFG